MCIRDSKNCFADVEGWAEISEEQVLERNPDYIMTISMYSGEGPTPEEEIASRAGWENLTAVKNGAILNLQNNELSRPAPVSYTHLDVYKRQFPHSAPRQYSHTCVRRP